MLDCKFIPSNILKAFINTKKQKIVKRKSTLLKIKFLLINENLISFIIKLKSTSSKVDIIIDKIKNFKFALRLYLSSKKPKKNIAEQIVMKQFSDFKS